MQLREYRPSDCEQLAELFYQTVHSVNAKDYTKEQLDVLATGKVDLDEWNSSFLKHKTLVAVEDDKIVGFVDMDNTGYLDRLYVHKDYQRKGVASAICDALKSFSTKKSIYHPCIYHSKTIFSIPRIPRSKRAEGHSTGNRFDKLCNGEVDSFRFAAAPSTAHFPQ